jgi:hypothetical protein
MKMKNMWTIFLLLIAFVLGVFVLMSSATIDADSEEQEKQKEQKQQKKKEMYPFSIDSNLFTTSVFAKEEYKTCPPLHPERFRRKMKMFYGIDINDYPENAMIKIDGIPNFKLSVKYQIMMNWNLPGDYWPFSTPYHEYTIFLPMRKYLIYHDTDAFHELIDASIVSYEEIVGLLNIEEVDTEIMNLANIPQIIYSRIVFQPPPLLMEYIGNNHTLCSYGLFGLANSYHEDSVDEIDGFSRTSDIRLDMLSLYLQKELSKGRKFVSDWSNKDMSGLFMGFPVDRMENGNLSSSFLAYISCYFAPVKYTPWPNYKIERGATSFLAFLLQLEHTVQNKFVIQFMSGQIDNKISGSKYGMSSLRDSIRSNDYYGYAVLREFCENPERKMPTLEKVGTSFRGRINNVAEALLYLEPFSDSYDIDTIRPNETFIAYEMGHDDYYFVEVVKPVESPIAGPDGYAMILDRTETVYGYLKRQEVREYTDTDTLSQTVATGKRKQGIINDTDGYVNIRKEMNAQSEILGKIVKNEIFTYWETVGSNWYTVKTQDGILGYVHRKVI